MARLEIIDAVPVVRAFEFPYHGKRVLGRILNYGSFMLAAPLAAFRAPKADVIYVWSPPLTIGIAAWIIARLRGIPFVYDVQDIWPEAVVLSGMLKPGFHAKCLSVLERFVYRRADHILVVTEGARDNLVKKGVPMEKLSVMPHWVDGELFRRQDPDDTKRPLTTKGIQRLKQAGKALVALDVTFDVILTSPLVRTRQTAEALAATFPDAPPIVNSQALAPGGAHNAIIDDVAKQSHRRKRIALVGHEPGLGDLAARLLGLRKPLEFKKGAIARFDVTSVPLTAPAQLRWFLTPRILRKIGK